MSYFKTYFTGLISLQGFQKDDLICDYHGEETFNVTYDVFKTRNGVDTRYCCEVKTGPNKRIIDATSEVCPLAIHDGIRCIGRLANHASRLDGKKANPACNMKLVDIPLRNKYQMSAPSTVACLIAVRDILPFEELRWDYEDEVARDVLLA